MYMYVHKARAKQKTVLLHGQDGNVGSTDTVKQTVEKYRSAIFTFYSFPQQIELDELNRTQQELKQGSGKLQDILQKLEREQVK